ncbi:MAG: hypothetical protein KatS3mg110_0674 [Pirellulaceae bacterium]|nr:MAG: hypothetical protein KatS3mg110_0674 [Pirellulaceae bacterium]
MILTGLIAPSVYKPGITGHERYTKRLRVNDIFPAINASITRRSLYAGPDVRAAPSRPSTFTPRRASSCEAGSTLTRLPMNRLVWGITYVTAMSGFAESSFPSAERDPERPGATDLPETFLRKALATGLRRIFPNVPSRRGAIARSVANVACTTITAPTSATNRRATLSGMEKFPQGAEARALSRCLTGACTAATLRLVVIARV